MRCHPLERILLARAGVSLKCAAGSSDFRGAGTRSRRPPRPAARPPIYFIKTWKVSIERYFMDAWGGKAELDFER
jgi:hypothetical protein